MSPSKKKSKVKKQQAPAEQVSKVSDDPNESIVCDEEVYKATENAGGNTIVEKISGDGEREEVKPSEEKMETIRGAYDEEVFNATEFLKNARASLKKVDGSEKRYGC